MVSQVTALQTQPRQLFGKHLKRLRRANGAPIHLYGPGIESQALQADASALRKVLVRVGRNRPVSVSVEGDSQTYTCFVREVQFDPRTETVLHVDFLRVDVTQRVELQIPIRLRGEAPAIRKGAAIFQVARDILVECLPLEAPSMIDVDISSLEEMGAAIRARDLTLPPGVTLLVEPDLMIVQAAAPVRVEVEEKEAPAAVAEEGAEGAAEEGEQPAEEEQKEE